MKTVTAKDKFKITQEISITRGCYNLQRWEKDIIQQCLNDNPNFTMKDLSDYLGISERTLFRKIGEHNLEMDFEKRFEAFKTVTYAKPIGIQFSSRTRK